jgi:septum formation protein
VRLVLASRSPQRKAILEQLGVPFEVRPADVREEETGEPAAVAAENARRKALAVPRAEGEVVLGVDTVVATEGGLWGKPADEQEARTTLLHLAGRAHEVHSGIVVLGDGGGKEAAAVTSVTFRAFGPDVLEWYVGAGEWRGRAGGYAIQGRGAALVERIDGDYLNVVGLPVAALLRVWPGLLALAL